jgi:hypothetical protein
MFKVVETEDHGRAVVATEKLEPSPFGLLVFKDPALLTFPTRGTERDQSGSVPEILELGPQMWTDWWAYLQEPDEIKQRVLDLYTEMECPPAVALRKYLIEKAGVRQEEKVQDEIFDKSILDHIEEFVKFSMVIRFNAVELCPPNADGSWPGIDFGHGLFENACKLSHSCKPNCVWITTQDGKAKEVRAITTIEKGEELTIDYIGHALEPIPQRRKELLMTKGFICECNRCSTEHDDTRRFKCINQESTDCPGVHFLHQPLLSIEAELLDCTHCGATAPQSHTKAVIQQELDLVQEISAADKLIEEHDVADASDMIERLEPPHDLHSLADKCYELQGELYSTRGEYRSAAEAYAKQINCRTAILGSDYNSQITAFCCERLGDTLRHVNVEEAEEVYKRTLRLLQLMRGGHKDPYANCTLNKLLEIQNRRAHCNSEMLPHQEGLEVITDAPGGPPRTEHPCELCGNHSKISVTLDQDLNYCCEEHRRMHLPLVHDYGLTEETKVA